MQYLKLERISLTLLIAFVSGFIALLLFPLVLSSTTILGSFLVKIAVVLLIIEGILPVVGFFTSFFTYETSSKAALAITHVILAVLYYSFGFWVLWFAYAAFANNI